MPSTAAPTGEAQQQQQQQQQQYVNMAPPAGNAAQTVRLESMDEVVFEVDAKVARMSVTISHMLDDINDAESSASAIPLPNVNGKILQKVLEYCRYHTENPSASSEPSSPPESNSSDFTKSAFAPCPWDKEFVDVDQSTLFELILAANYLDIKPLLDLTCRTVAEMIKYVHTHALHTPPPPRLCLHPRLLFCVCS
jgi:S-phase kinase-associated protein 1